MTNRNTNKRSYNAKLEIQISDTVVPVRGSLFFDSAIFTSWLSYLQQYHTYTSGDTFKGGGVSSHVIAPGLVDFGGPN